MTLSIRPMQPDDVSKIVRYWSAADPEDFIRMGVEASRVPSAEHLERQLLALCDLPATAAESCYRIWCVDESPVGYASLKNIVYGDRGDMHLHMWENAVRGRGYGGVLFCLSAVDFYDRFQLRKIVCEPRAANPMPNRMLQRVGFPLDRTYWGASSELSAHCELNSYLIQKEVAIEYLVQRRRDSNRTIR